MSRWQHPFGSLLPPHLLKRLGRGLVLLLWLGAAHSLRAVPPSYTVKKTIRLSDLHPGGGSIPMTLTGLNSAGMLSGYFRYTAKVQNVTKTYVHAFAWDDAHQQLYNLNDALSSSATSMATCVNSAGVVAGVYYVNQVGEQKQLGFTWQSGGVTSFAGPDDMDVDAIIAINSAGLVIGVYYGPYGLKRAFLWDGTSSTDLGDLGDAAESFVWPQAINSSGEVTGTVYVPGDEINEMDSFAFHWQSGVMSALAGTENLPNTSVGRINSAGEIVGGFTIYSGNSQSGKTPAGFYWYNDNAADLGNLGGGGTVPFSINSQGLIIGTSYTKKNVLHLFSWQGGALNDLGIASLNVGDTAFEISSVNQAGDLVGFVTDVNNSPQAFVRTGGAFYNLAAVMPGSIGFVAPNTNDRRLLINNPGLIACSGYSQGTPVILLLIADSDSDGLPDGWEIAYFGNLSQGASGDYDGDGLTNLQEFQQDTNPNDYYNDVLTNLSIDSGNNQSAGPNAWVANPLVVSVTDGVTNAAKANAPIVFASPTAQLSTSPTGAGSSSVQVRSNAQGKATIYLKLPATGIFHQVTASANNGAPVIFYAGLAQLTPSPASIGLSVDQGEVRERVITLVNSTSQSINYAIDPPSVNAEFVPDLPQDANNPEYNWTDSNATGGPAYVWNDISATGTLLDINSFAPYADEGSQQISLPFSFPFFGNQFTSAWISTNGYLTFEAGSYASFSNPLPGTNMPANLVAPFFKDLNLSYSGSVYYKATATKLTVQFDSVPAYSGIGTYTYQMVLQSSGVIIFYYKTMTGTVSDATAGIQNGDTTSPHGRQVSYNSSTYLHDGLAVQLHPIAIAPTAWMQLKSYVGTVAAGQSASVDLTLSTVGLAAGTYTTTLHLKDSAGNTVGPDVPISWTVSGNPVVDSDDDGLLPDAWEMLHFGNLNQGANGDPDHDGLSNLLEYRLGSDPIIPDTNGDGILDGVAYRLGISVTNLDMDGDGVSNAVERQRGTDPFSRDSDRDGVPDGQDAFPLDSTRVQTTATQINNHTPLTIILLEPSSAIPLN